MKLNAKEKAKELVNTMLSCNPNLQDGISAIDTIQAKLCAGKAVDEILHYSKAHGFIELTKFYEEIKQEIEKL